MSIFRKPADLAASGMGATVHALTAGFDALTGLVARMNGRVEAHLRDRTTLLRAHYARRSNRQSRPLPVVDGPVDLSLRGGIRQAA